MKLTKNQLVVFENGHKAPWDEVFWSEKHKAFCLATDEEDEEGRRIILFSTTVIEKPARAKRKFVPSSESCTVEIFPVGETEKAYQIPDGSNGKVGHCKEYYKWIAKSICYTDETGRIFAPSWA